MRRSVVKSTRGWPDGGGGTDGGGGGATGAGGGGGGAGAGAGAGTGAGGGEASWARAKLGVSSDSARMSRVVGRITGTFFRAPRSSKPVSFPQRLGDKLPSFRVRDDDAGRPAA